MPSAARKVATTSGQGVASRSSSPSFTAASTIKRSGRFETTQSPTTKDNGLQPAVPTDASISSTTTPRRSKALMKFGLYPDFCKDIEPPKTQILHFRRFSASASGLTPPGWKISRWNEFSLVKSSTTSLESNAGSEGDEGVDTPSPSPQISRLPTGTLMSGGAVLDGWLIPLNGVMEAREFALMSSRTSPYLAAETTCGNCTRSPIFNGTWSILSKLQHIAALVATALLTSPMAVSGNASPTSGDEPKPPTPGPALVLLLEV
mmetsp:Transcript_45198/g.115963  ORF Transcript_45198/g.115963 Transcript_45198/m.115963 type:complete len:262 (+) Transcript_45198:1074-1859(+)